MPLPDDNLLPQRPPTIRAMAVIWLLALLVTGSAAALDRVSGPAALMAALDAATGGETIRLVGGDYGELELAPRTRVRITFDRPVTIISDNPADPAVFQGLDLREATNITFDSLVFEYASSAGAPLYTKPFQLSAVRAITIRNCLFEGDNAHGVSDLADGFATGFGLSVRGGTDIVIENNEIRGFFRGLVTGGVDGLTVRGNNIHDLRMDGMNFSSVRQVVIEDNYIHDFRRSRDPKDHADMIQFWTNGTKQPSTDIVIRNNVLMAGLGNFTQSIFMRNDLVDRGLAGSEMFYQRVTIEDNVIVNGHLHGITLGEAVDVVIRRNTLLRTPAAAKGENLVKEVRIPRIRVADAARDVIITDNIVAAVPKAQPSWRVSGNLIAQDVTATKAGYYHQLFVNAQSGDPRDLGNFAVRPGGPADRPGLGAPLLRQGANRSRYAPRRLRGTKGRTA